ncbi:MULTISPECIES: hypothetical protein [Moorena]|uniref:Flagellar assembly protein H n=1 Tax=Moorena producens 3L TaxID=489825 RepID=F4XYM3_9CYAN|nr:MULTISPECIES: hypothetical protein [Moorena]NES85385.1 hypothetical protein [Moorena sp. SIO2B7]EGJ30310.1 hypothetical protein LYNGBM3L_52090 [Moorena producens 3L]NEP34451.1 hypothetical protein [Moorena sp. SIO3B2]NEP64206.1 hypothetical protein [Moorena sp. SIO3A5]NEQ08242.1 hypothetical protein [Moorena sp. SIO4E2]
MTRQPHDQFAKQYLTELLTAHGQVEVSRELTSEVRQVDIWFLPTASESTAPQEIGLLGQMASTACLLEPFRNATGIMAVRNCLLKLFALYSDLQRKARREKNLISETDLPCLWILSPSCSGQLLNGFGAKLDNSGNWVKGVYFLPEWFNTALVAINQLPVTEETLWLRILGRDRTQAQAINELLALPDRHPKRRNILEILANWRIKIDKIGESEDLTEDDRELIMNLSPAYLRWREETLEQGREQGKEQGNLEGQRLMVENLLAGRFGTVDLELSRTIEPLMQLPITERTQVLLNLSNLSRQELLDRFGDSRSD